MDGGDITITAGIDANGLGGAQAIVSTRNQFVHPDFSWDNPITTDDIGM